MLAFFNLVIIAFNTTAGKMSFVRFSTCLQYVKGECEVMYRSFLTFNAVLGVLQTHQGKVSLWSWHS